MGRSPRCSEGSRETGPLHGNGWGTRRRRGYRLSARRRHCRLQSLASELRPRSVEIRRVGAGDEHLEREQSHRRAELGKPNVGE